MRVRKGNQKGVRAMYGYPPQGYGYPPQSSWPPQQPVAFIPVPMPPEDLDNMSLKQFRAYQKLVDEIGKTKEDKEKKAKEEDAKKKGTVSKLTKTDVFLISLLSSPFVGGMWTLGMIYLARAIVNALH